MTPIEDLSNTKLIRRGCNPQIEEPKKKTQERYLTKLQKQYPMVEFTVPGPFAFHHHKSISGMQSTIAPHQSEYIRTSLYF